jgi:hypothetical protein
MAAAIAAVRAEAPEAAPAPTITPLRRS